ncbi:MAG: ABC transporter permease [Oscillospiraceae bacterium]|nr:ABC transporter permease [Oscillospiraceae bacterium]
MIGLRNKTKLTSAPYIVWMAAFIIVPLAMIIFFAFTREDGTPTIDNIIGIGRWLRVFWNSFCLAFLSTAICLVIAYPMAYALSRSKVKKQRTLLVLITLPMWMSFLLKTYALMTLLEDTGIINNLLRMIGLGPYHMINTSGAVVFGMVYDFLPFMILPLYTVMIKIDHSLLEAADDLGANNRKTLMKIVLPLSLPGIISGITMVFVPSVSSFVISRFLGGSKIELIGDLIEYNFIQKHNPHIGSALSLILMIVILILMGIMNTFDDEEIGEMLI